MDHLEEQKTINAKKDNNDQMEVEEHRLILAKLTVLANSEYWQEINYKSRRS